MIQILTTAVFSVLLLGRSLSAKRWASVILLTVGVAIVSLPSGGRQPSLVIHDTSDHFFPRSMHELGQAAGGAADVARELTRRAVDGLAEGAVGLLAKRSATYEGIEADTNPASEMNYSLGLTAVLVAAVVSGLTGVYFEKVLKESASPVSVWTRNIQLSFYSLFPAVVFGVIMKDGEDIARHGFFEGYNSVVWTAVVFQAIGGVLTSLCINYADNIAKNFATSISIIISFIFSLWFFGFAVSSTVRIARFFLFAPLYLLPLVACLAWFDKRRSGFGCFRSGVLGSTCEREGLEKPFEMALITRLTLHSSVQTEAPLLARQASTKSDYNFDRQMGAVPIDTHF